jgi:hypothetical protein
MRGVTKGRQRRRTYTIHSTAVREFSISGNLSGEHHRAMPEAYGRDLLEAAEVEENLIAQQAQGAAAGADPVIESRLTPSPTARARRVI